MYSERAAWLQAGTRDREGVCIYGLQGIICGLLERRKKKRENTKAKINVWDIFSSPLTLTLTSNPF